ncbi:MAG: hypothetical protein LQ345_000855 [Seirophora villosa]|nr:MAG: hypothetical protein LQ345_000855 [Seirophora villosa]
MARGLVDCPYGPSLKHFPFAEDATAIVSSIRAFLANYVSTYYPTCGLRTSDREIQDLIAEANGAARVLDFPPASLDRRTTLINMLTHLAYVTGASHHALNSNAPSAMVGLLRTHSATKGVSDLVSLPPQLEPITQSGHADYALQPTRSAGGEGPAGGYIFRLCLPEGAAGRDPESGGKV